MNHHSPETDAGPQDSTVGGDGSVKRRETTGQNVRKKFESIVETALQPPY